MAERKITSLTMPVLVVLLAVAAFLAGMFWTKIRYLEEDKKQVADQGEMIVQASPAPEEGLVLGEGDMAKIVSGGAGFKGEDNAPVTVVEFSEYQCPFCKRYVDEAYQQIWQEYGNQIRYIFRDYPLSFHQHAQTMAEAARCAGDQGQYWQMHDLLFEKRDTWAEKQDVSSDLTSYAQSLGLKTEDFNNCLESGKYTQAVKDDFDLGQSVGVTGTPTFFINGQKLVGAQPFEAFQAFIDAELAK